MLVGVLSFAQAIHGPKQKNKEVLSVECCALVSKKECKRIEAHVPKIRSGNPFFATDLSPFETVFIKTNNHLPIFEYVEQVAQRMQSASDVVIRQDGFIRQKNVKQSRSKQRSKRRRPRRRPAPSA